MARYAGRGDANCAGVGCGGIDNVLDAASYAAARPGYGIDDDGASSNVFWRIFGIFGGADVKLEDGKPRGTLVITINNNGENAAFTELARVSKPGRRIYVSSADIPKVKQGRGIVLVSTSKGVMTGAEAAKAKLGGEVLLKVY